MRTRRKYSRKRVLFKICFHRMIEGHLKLAPNASNPPPESTPLNQNFSVFCQDPLGCLLRQPRVRETGRALGRPPETFCAAQDPHRTVKTKSK